MKVFSTNEIHIYGMEQLSFPDCYTKSSEVTRCAFLLVTRFYSLRFFTRCYFLLVAFLLVAFFYSLHFGLFWFVLFCFSYFLYAAMVCS